MKPSNLLARVVIFTLLLTLSSGAAFAKWDSPGNLPGITSNKTVILTGVIGGGVIAALLFHKHRSDNKLRTSPFQAPQEVKFTSTDRSLNLPLTNRGEQTLSVSEIGFFGGSGFTTGLSTPVTIPPKGEINLQVDRTGNSAKKSRLSLTALTPEGKSITRDVKLVVEENE